MKKLIITIATLVCMVASAAKIGIISDTHIGWKGTSQRLEAEYRLMKKHNVDRIINLGDICDKFNPKWFAEYVSIREKVYGAGLPPETYIYAGHDKMGKKSPAGDSENAAVMAEVKKLLRIPNERYDRFECEGFTFLVYPQSKDYARMEKEIDAECAAHPGRPLFVLDHVPPNGTVQGSRRGGDYVSRKIFNKHPEVIVLTGHVHNSLVHEGKIWQGEFTALGFGTIKHGIAAVDGEFFAAIMDLNKDRAIIHRYDIASGEEVRPETPWTLTFPYNSKTAPYRPELRRQSVPAPSFPADAKIVAKTVGKPVKKVVLEFPASSSPDIAEYEINAFVRSGTNLVLRTSIYRFSDYTRRAEKRVKKVMCELVSGYFNAGEKIRFSVTPIDFYGNRGKAIECEAAIGEVEKWTALYDGVPAPAKKGKPLKFSKYNMIFDVPESAMDCASGTEMRIVIDAALELSEDSAASFNLRLKDQAKYAFGYINTPPGKSHIRYVREFRRPKDMGDYALFLQKSSGGKITFDNLRIEKK